MRMTSTTQTGIPLANQSNRAEDILDLRGVRKRRSVLRRPRRRNIDLVQKRPQREGIPLLHTGVRTQQTEVLLQIIVIDRSRMTSFCKKTIFQERLPTSIQKAKLIFFARH